MIKTIVTTGSGNDDDDVAETVPLTGGLGQLGGLPNILVVFDMAAADNIPFTAVYPDGDSAALGIRQSIDAGDFVSGDKAYLVELFSGFVIAFVGTDPDE